MLAHEPAWPEPEPAEGWTVVKVLASGICGSDLPRIQQTGMYAPHLIPGHEFSGVVSASRSKEIVVGQPVAVLPIIPCGHCPGCRIGPFHCTQYDFIGSRRDGGFAEYCAVPGPNLLPLPANITAEEGAFAEPLAVGLHVLRRAQMRPGGRVLVLGGGAIGILIAQWAGIFGAAEVTLADVRDASLVVAAACGVAQAVNVRSEAFDRLGEFDVIFEAAGANQALQAAIAHAAHRGTTVVVGREVSDTVVPLKRMEQMMRKEIDLKSCWGYDLADDRQFLLDVLAAGRLTISPMITRRISLQEGAAAIQEMWDKSFFYCKVMFTF
jgi:L-iditol 2-dehydrogenase